MAAVLELEGITKRFPGILANDGISLSLQEGEILALLGENGAGKTTLMNILYGLYHPDEGRILIRGQVTRIRSPGDAIRAGIGMVHQHFMLIPVFTVTENVMLGDESTQFGGILDHESTAKRIREISSTYKLEIDPGARVSTLPVGVQQRVEIIKLLYREASILIFDEPTSVLTPQEADQLFGIMRSLAASGKSIIFITHKLREVLEVADRITVIRQGRVVGTTTPQAADMGKLASMMVGRDVVLEVEKAKAKPTGVTLRVQNLKVLSDRSTLAVNGVSFDVSGGEVLGIAGVQGNGQTELVEALTGLRHVVDGRIELLGTDVTHATPRQITELGTAHIPEDRQRDGLVLAYPVTDNLVLNTYYIKPFAEKAVLQPQAILRHAGELVEAFDIRTPSPLVDVGTLSGGNQQKVIVARELSRPIKLMIAAQPTRGLDVGSIEYIHGRVIEKRDQGVAVLLVSTELDEIMQLSDRIAVMYRGQIVDVVAIEEATKERVGLLMAGIHPESASAGGRPTRVKASREVRSHDK